jgi:hypothetical protein
VGEAQRQLGVDRLAEADRAGAQVQVAHRDLLAGGGVAEAHRRVLHPHPAERERGERRTLTGAALAAGGREVLPVAAPGRVAGQVQLQPAHADGVHLHLAAEQRHQLHAHLGPLHPRERRVAEAGRVAHAQLAHRDPQPRQHREAHVAGDRDVAPGARLDLLGDGVLVVVGVEEQRRGQRHHDQQHDQVEHAEADEAQQAAGEGAFGSGHGWWCSQRCRDRISIAPVCLMAP